MEILILISIISFVLLILIWNIYASLIKKKNKVKEAASGINVQLKKRFDLIPNILKIANKFMEHEKSLMEEITKLRSQAVALGNDTGDVGKKLSIDKEIKEKLSRIAIAVENYPQLKSDQTMLDAMSAYNDIEEHIAAARRFYNSAVNELNNAVEIFPSSLIALMLGIKTAEFFNEIDAQEKKSINASDYLK